MMSKGGPHELCCMQDESCIAGHLGERAAKEDATVELVQPEQGEQHDDAPAASSGAAHEQPAAAVGVADRDRAEAIGVGHNDGVEGRARLQQGEPLDERGEAGSGSSGSGDSGGASEDDRTAAGDSAGHSR